MEFPCLRIVADVRKVHNLVEDQLYDTPEYDFHTSNKAYEANRFIIRNMTFTESEPLRYILHNHPNVDAFSMHPEKQDHTAIQNFRVNLILNSDKSALEILSECTKCVVNIVDEMKAKIEQIL